MITTDKKFISEIPGFEFPNGVLNKKVAGCGATEFAIMNDEPTVILSPRLGLIESKVNQHPEILEVRGGVTVDEIKAFKGNKLISTYDSFYKIKEAIDLTKYRVLCDEMQFIIKDSAFKSGVVRRMLQDLRDLPKVTFISATPLENIYKNLSFFKEIPYEEIDWTENTVKEQLNLISAKSPLLEAAKLAKSYANGVYKEGTDSILIFVNSINGICSIIKKAGLTPENTNVLMADTDGNRAKLSKVGFLKGNLPNRGEAYKPVTICTSAYAAGADFYNKAAILYVVSDVYITKPFSIADEIPQIAGRLRLGNKGINLIYRAGTTKYASIEEKKARTAELVKGYNLATGVVREKQISSLEASIQIGGPCDTDYMFYNRETDRFEEDELAVVADIYNNDILKTYKNGIILSKGLKEDFETTTQKVEDSDKMEIIKRDRGFETALQDYITGDQFQKNSAILQYPMIGEYMGKITPKQAKALSYQEAKIKNFIASNEKMSDIKGIILAEFTGEMPVKRVKEVLGEIYAKKHIDKAAKATDIVALLPDYYEIKNKFIDNRSVKKLVRIK